MIKQRIDYIDVAKGLCMVLVVWQHTHTYYKELQTGEFYMESFRMPLFFLISGMFFKLYDGIDAFVKKKLNTIVIPFLFFYLIFSVLVPNVLYVVGYEGLRESSTLGWKALFNCVFEKTYSNSPVWFLLALLWLNFIFYGFSFISSKLSRGKNQIIVLLILSVVCGLVGFYVGFNNIFIWANFDNALTACPFFFVGYYLKNKTSVINNPPKIAWLITIIVVGIIYIYLFSHGLSFKQNKWDVENLVPLYTCGIIGSLAVIAFSKIIEKSRLLKYYGENTLILLCLQMPVIQVVNIFVKKLNISDMGQFLLTFLGVMLVFLAIIPIMNKFLPWFTGKKNLIK